MPPRAQASRHLASLTTEKRTAILYRVADALLAHEKEIFAANEEDVKAAEGKISDSLLQRQGSIGRRGDKAAG